MKSSIKLIKIMLIVACVATLLSFETPAGWLKAGSCPENYEMGIDKAAGLDGKDAASIRSIKKRIRGFGTLMQTCSAVRYNGKRVRMSGMLKTKDVGKWAGLWFRIDPVGAGKSLGFDNMKDGQINRSIKGTTDWKRYEIVLDVPEEAGYLAYGALLVGKGQIWFDDIKFEVVDSTVATTGRQILKEPFNLDFEKK